MISLNKLRMTLTVVIVCLITTITASQDFNFFFKVVEWSPDGSMIAVGGSAEICDSTTPNPQRLRVLNSETLVEVYSIPDIGCGIADVSWSPTSDAIAIADTSIGVRVWDLSIQDYDGNILVPAAPGPPLSVSWSPDGSSIALATRSGLVTIVNVDTGERSQRFNVTGASVDWDPTGTQLAVASFNEFILFDAVNPSVALDSIQFDFGMISDINWSQDDNFIIGYSIGQKIRVASTTPFNPSLEINTDFLTDIDLSPTRNLIAGVGPGSPISVWNASDGTLVTTISVSNVYGLTWSPDGSHLTYVGDVSSGVTTLDLPNSLAGIDQTVTDSDSSGSENVILDGSASTDSDGTIVSYVWTENGTQIATGMTPTVDLAVGAHTITLTVTDDDGLTATDDVTVNVLEPSSITSFTLVNADTDTDFYDSTLSI